MGGGGLKISVHRGDFQGENVRKCALQASGTPKPIAIQFYA
ncbi:hypothetical protein EC3234A_261c00050 [Escherichia coli]|nr:hypothetical protein EC3234A_261c00050 [Escherichia coli]